jgi:hypothetical protein
MDVNATLDALKAAQSNPVPDEIAKAYNVATGLVNYDLEGPAKKLYPVLTPLRNKIPRVGTQKGDTATRWRAITGIDITRVHPGISEGHRGGVISTSVKDYVAAYVGLGLEDFVTFEADYAGQGFDDVRARAVEGLLNSLMIAEELQLLGGNSSLSIGKPSAAPTLTASASGGSLSAAVLTGGLSVIVVPLTAHGLTRASVGTGIIQTFDKTNADGSEDTINGGCGIKSDAATVSVTGSSASVAVSIPPVRGAFGYAFFAGAPGTERLYSIRTINSEVITSLPTTTQLASALDTNDHSAQGIYAMQGLEYLAADPTSGAYYAALPTGTAGTGTPLTSDGAGGIVEIDTALQWFWDNLRLSPNELWVSAQELISISSKVIKGGSAPLFRFNLDAKTENVSIIAGAVVGQYLNKLTQTLINIRIHPNATAGTMLFLTDTIPYKISNVGSVYQVKTRREYNQLEWPLRTRQYEYGVYVDEVLQHYFPPSLGIITNIAAG